MKWERGPEKRDKTVDPIKCCREAGFENGLRDVKKEADAKIHTMEKPYPRNKQKKEFTPTHLPHGVLYYHYTNRPSVFAFLGFRRCHSRRSFCHKNAWQQHVIQSVDG